MHGRPGQVGLLLDAAGVGQHRARVLQERGELEVAERRAERQPVEQAGGVQPRARPRVHREDDRQRERLDQLHQPLQARGVVDVAGPVGGHEHELARGHPVGLEDLGAVGRARAEQQRDVDHHVADHLDPAGHPLRAQVQRRRLGRAQQQRRRVVGQHAVELLRHRAVERAHAGLDVRDRDLSLGGGQRARQRRVRVAVDEHQVGALARQQALERLEHARGLGRVGAAAELEVVLGPRQAELGEEDLGELLVVVLAGVDQHLLRFLAQPVGHRRRLDELRPVPDDG